MIRGKEFAPFAKYAPMCSSDIAYYGVVRYDAFLEKFKKFSPDGEHWIKNIMQDSELADFDKDPWTYYFNKYNFRDEFNINSKKQKVGFFGCSFTFGEGIKSEDTFVHKAAKNLDLEYFNFGAPGSSVERVARTFSMATKLVDLDYAIITFPSHYRQFYQAADASIINIIPGWPHAGYKKTVDTIYSLEDEFFIVKTISYINWIHDVAKFNGIKILYSSWDHPLNELCQTIAPSDTINAFPNIDDKCARDKMHPGTKSQAAHAEQIIKAFNDRAWV
jgi:hypothetical protein